MGKQSTTPLLQTKHTPSLLEQEAIFGVRKRERMAYLFGLIGGLIGLAGVNAISLMLPLKQTEAYLAIVDKDTGIAERAVTVQNAQLKHSAALKQSLLFSYVQERETFDTNDNDTRILSVYQRSSSAARNSLVALWNEDSDNYPPDVFGSNAKITVDVLSITQISDETAQVRFTKTLNAPGQPVKEGKFYATVTYRFKPETKKRLKLVWQNPFGFEVVDYRTTSETVEGQS